MKVPYGTRIGQLRDLHPSRRALTVVDATGTHATLTWDALERRSNQIARALQRAGAGPSRIIAICLPNGLDHYLSAIAAWKVGACVLPLSPRLPTPELDRLMHIAGPIAVVAASSIGGYLTLGPHDLDQTLDLPDHPLGPITPRPWKAIASGGSTGAPKLIVDTTALAGSPGHFVRTQGAAVGMRAGQTQLVSGPLYHNSPFCWGFWGLFEDHHVVVLERFRPDLAVEVIRTERIHFACLVPTMMRRIIELPNLGAEDFASIEAIWHTAAPCAPDLKRAWIDLLGPSRLYEAYGATEGQGWTVIRGDEWLEHPGSVGRPVGCDLRILGPDGTEVGHGTVGEIFMRPTDGEPGYRYLGAAPARHAGDGYESVGDLGWMDDDGYLYYADRRTDLIVSGGANVYPAEVEAALLAVQGVRDVAVVGLPDTEWGRRVHAIVERDSDSDSTPTASDLEAAARACLAPYKLPRSYEFVDRLPRDPSGKIRRSALLEARAPTQE